MSRSRWVSGVGAAAVLVIVGCGGRLAPDATDEPSAEPELTCTAPAPVLPALQGGIPDQWIVSLDPEVDFDAEVAAIAMRHDLSVLERLSIINAFVVNASAVKVAALRCEPSVRRLTQDRRLKATVD